MRWLFLETEKKEEIYHDVHKHINKLTKGMIKEKINIL